MISRYRISLNGVQMDSLDDNLLILDIKYTPPERTVLKYTTANLDGCEMKDLKIIGRKIAVVFELHEYDTVKRNALCQKVNNWAAGGGTLMTNDREDQRLLNVVCEQYADIDSVKDWTAPITMVFSTTYVPNWVSNDETSKTLTGKNVTGNMNLDGNIGEALVSVTATAQESVTSIKLTVGSKTLDLTGLSVATGQTIVVDYIKNRYLRIRANGGDVMPKLKATSSDNLTAECGKITGIGVVSDGRVSAVFKARGCWR